jgi:hypothetical protein
MQMQQLPSSKYDLPYIKARVLGLTYNPHHRVIATPL